MDTPQDETSHPTASQKAAYSLLVIILMGIGIFFLVQGISQFWSQWNFDLKEAGCLLERKAGVRQSHDCHWIGRSYKGATIDPNLLS